MKTGNNFNVESAMTVYHGSFIEIQKPVLDYSRKNTDFGIGFYLTKDKKMADKWATVKNPPVVNSYILYLYGLTLYTFNADEEWFDFVVANRKGLNVDTMYNKFDVLSGPTADDKLFTALSEYLEGAIPKELALEMVSSSQLNHQLCIKSQKGLENLKFQYSKTLKGKELQDYIEQFKYDSIEGSNRYKKLKQQFLGGTYFNG